MRAMMKQMIAVGVTFTMATVVSAEMVPVTAQECVPDIVQSQLREEQQRQNTEWTLENQALYPKQYCQAQLVKLAGYASQLNVQAHRYAVTKSRVERLIADDEVGLAGLVKFLQEAKAAYRKAEADNAWPVKLRGIAFSKSRTQEKILEAAQKIEPLKVRIEKRKFLLSKIASRQERVAQEQQNVIRIRELVQNTLTDLELKSVVEADRSISETVRAIGDSLRALSMDCDGDFSVDELIQIETEEMRQAQFDAIMAE